LAQQLKSWRVYVWVSEVFPKGITKAYRNDKKDFDTRVGLNIPQIKLLAIWVGGMHCVIVTKLCGAKIFGAGGFKHRWATMTPTTMATAQRDTTKMMMAMEYDDYGDDDNDDGNGRQ